MRDDSKSTSVPVYPHCDSPSSDQPSPTFKHSLVPLEPIWANDFPNGLTPPPESLGPGDLLEAYRHPIYSEQVSPLSPQGHRIQQPPTPPRTEHPPELCKISQLSRESRDSQQSSPQSSVPTPEALFPERDVKGRDMDLSGFSNMKTRSEQGFAGYEDDIMADGYEEGEQGGKGMTEFFDFDSAASSPLRVANRLVSSNSPTRSCSPFTRSLSPQLQPFHTFPAGPVPLNGWRSKNPPSGDKGFCSNGRMDRGQASGKANRKRSLSSESFDGTLDAPGGGSVTMTTPPPVRKTSAGPPQLTQHFIRPNISQPQVPSVPMPDLTFSIFGAQQIHLPSTLLVDQIPTKSRVETQILVRLQLLPFPEGITKLHLPRHCISKPKLYAKPPFKKSLDMLELHASLVCASAMRKPELLRKALARARGESSPPLFGTEHQRIDGAEGSSGEESDNKESVPKGDDPLQDDESPLNGGEVKICLGCISRERKRAARKKPKQIKEEEEWMADEPKRAIVFNNTEIREWIPTAGLQTINGKTEGHNRIIGAWNDGMMVELHMRLACYCRHQGEKEGFRVIFTIKNHAGVVLAQQITSSILITDDHKSSMATPLPIGISHDIQLVGSGFQFPQTLLPPGLYGSLGANIPSHDNQQGFSPTNIGANTKVGAGAAPAPQPPRFLQSSFSPPPPFSGQGGLPGSPASPSGSLQMSPLATPAPGANPSSKKRRINSVPKVPTNLTMTRLDNQRSAFQPTGQTPISGPAPHVQGVPASSLGHFPTSQPPSAFWAEEPMTPPTMSDQSGFQLEGHSNNPFVPLDNRRQFTSPQSARASRAPSPTSHEAFLRAQVGSRIPMPLQNQARQIPSDVYQGHSHEPDAPPIPEISRLVPHEGTCRGGIEVTVLGRGFVEGLTVVFGDTPASYNLCFSATTMVCMLPPNVSPGPVVVSLKNVQLRMGADKVRFFTYIDDADKALMELALQIVGMKMRGTMSNAQDIARSIIENSGSAFGQGSPQPSESGGGSNSQQHQYLRCLAGEGGFGRQGLEEILMKFLDAIDIDDSPYPAPLNLIDKAGQTMLHLACMLGMERFVAALLARGASPRIPDKNGYTALHFAALHRHAEIYRRLLRHNANPNTQTKNGDTPMDLALKARGRAGQHTHSRHQSRASSTSSDFHVGNRSRASSTASLPSMRDSTDHGSRKPMGIDDYFNTGDEVSGKNVDENPREPWAHSRRSSRHEVAASAGENTAADQTAAPDAVAPQGLALAAATAWREHIAPSFQNLQNHWNLPTMPTAADYQHIFQNPMAAFQNPMARFHALMPPFPPFAPFAQGREDGDYKWWELFSAPQAPPAYEELFPQPGDAKGPAGDVLLERGKEVEEAKVSPKEALVLPASSTFSSSASTGSVSSLDLEELRYRIAKDVRELREQQQEYRAHTRKMKKIENDRRLYFFWLPALIFIMIAMALSYGPALWYAWKVIVSFLVAVFEDPSSIKESLAAMASGVAVAGGFLQEARAERV